MAESPAPTIAWQYVLVWTPGPVRSTVQLWATTRSGTRALWDSWESEGLDHTPSIHEVLGALYRGAVDAHERATATS